MSHLIALSDPREDLSRDLLEAPGGFAWWYIDLLDDNGDGFVIIWSFGLPFLPGYLGAARAGRPVTAGCRPSLNVALYKRGRPEFYLLQEYDADQVEWRPGFWRFGQTTIEASDRGSSRKLDMHLDCSVPRSNERLCGTIHLSGSIPGWAEPVRIDREASHTWCPMTGPAWCQATFQVGSMAPWMVAGWAYHDRNGGHRPLDRLGIDRWTWGRVVGEDKTQIYYVLWPQDSKASTVAWGLDVTADGRVKLYDHLQADLHDETSATFGMPYHRRVVLRQDDGTSWLTSWSEHLLDDGPFYLRNHIRVEGSEARGIGEWVDPDRIDQTWQRPFVRMRVHRMQGPNSMWLPLFSGPKDGRWRRLVGI